MSNLNWNKYEYVDYLDVKNIEINKLPTNISIATMCASCKLNTKLNIQNIEKYLQLNMDDILTVKINKERMRTLIDTKKKKRERNKKNVKVKKDVHRNHFYNQITVIIRITHGYTNDIYNEPKINLKLFKNGSIQMSGCKNIEGINIVLNKLLYKLKEVKAKLENNQIIEKLFIESNSNLSITGFKIDMINSNYRVNMQINRLKLYKLLLQKKVKTIYEPCIRACVIIKYIPTLNNYDLKEINVFIFQRGNIVIIAKSQEHIIEAYDYINDILQSHKNDVIKTDKETLILSLYDDIIKDITLGIANF